MGSFSLCDDRVAGGIVWKRVFLYLFQEYLCLGFERKNFYES